jgi:hypothetical protein
MGKAWGVTMEGELADALGAAGATGLGCHCPLLSRDGQPTELVMLSSDEPVMSRGGAWSVTEAGRQAARAAGLITHLALAS